MDFHFPHKHLRLQQPKEAALSPIFHKDTSYSPWIGNLKLWEIASTVGTLIPGSAVVVTKID